MYYVHNDESLSRRTSSTQQNSAPPDLGSLSMQSESPLEVIAGGTTGLIKLRDGHAFVEKVPYPDSRDTHLSIRDLQREYNAYQRLPPHPRLLPLHPDSTPQKLILPYLRHGCLHHFLRTVPGPSSTQRLQFASDAAEALSLLHESGIVHGDVNSWNFLVDDEFRLCVIDFSGSTVDGLNGSAFEGVRYCLPRSIEDLSTVRTDLFALGSLIYEIVTGREPFADVLDREVEELFGKGEFPETRSLRLGWVMRGCWRGGYGSARLVFEDCCRGRDGGG